MPFTSIRRIGRDITARRRLASQSDANAGKWAVEADCGALCRIEASVHRAEEEVAAIANTDFGTRVSDRHAREAADVGHRNGMSALHVHLRVIVAYASRVRVFFVRVTGGLVLRRRMVLNLGFLAPEQNRRVGPPSN